MWLKSNGTGAIKFIINNRTTNQHYPLQNSSLGKPHTAGDVAATPGSSAGSIHVDMPSTALSRPFGCCPQFQNDNLWGGIWVSGKVRSHTDSDQRSMGNCGTTMMPFLVKNMFTGWHSVTGSVVCWPSKKEMEIWKQEGILRYKKVIMNCVFCNWTWQCVG